MELQELLNLVGNENVNQALLWEKISVFEPK